MNNRRPAVIERAIAAGVLPADAAWPDDSDARPWPLVLLMAVGAWLATLPALGVLALVLFGHDNQYGAMYVAAITLLLAAVAILRTPTVPLFAEQMALPLMLLGLSSLGVGLFTDFPLRVSAGCLVLVALAIALPIPRAWVRTLLGAFAAAMLLLALDRGLDGGRSGLHGVVGWDAVHGVLLVWLVAQLAQRVIRQGGQHASMAAAIEALSAGWLVVGLAGLALSSGMTYLLGGTGAGALVGAVAREFGGDAALVAHQGWLATASGALGLGALAVAAVRWPLLRQPVYLCAGLVVASLAWFLPTLGAALLVIALTVTGQRYRLAALAALAAVWIVGSFYYQLQWPLAHKALLLALAGALLGALSWGALRGARSGVGGAESPPVTLWEPRRFLVAVSVGLTLALVNFGIWEKERLTNTGQPVFVELAPVDPRSLMQGDFMRLDFLMPRDVTMGERGLASPQHPLVVARRDQRGVATLLRLQQPGAALGEGEFLIELTAKGGRWILVTDAWFFKEGDGARWAAARYGEFRVGADGRALLVGMADANLKPILR